MRCFRNLTWVSMMQRPQLLSTLHRKILARKMHYKGTMLISSRTGHTVILQISLRRLKYELIKSLVLGFPSNFPTFILYAGEIYMHVRFVCSEPQVMISLLQSYRLASMQLPYNGQCFEWKKYMCQVSENDIFTTVRRLTPFLRPDDGFY